MKKMPLCLLLGGLLTLFSCEKVGFAPVPANTPEAIFEDLWTSFRQYYTGFDDRSIDWDQLYQQYRPMVSAATSADALHGIITAMLAHLDDGHVQVTAPQKTLFYANRIYNERPDDELFDLEVIKGYYLDRLKVGADDSYVSGLVNTDIAYIHLPYIGENMSEIPKLIDDFPYARGLIIDLRHNSGGDFTYALAHLKRLTNEQRLVFTSRTKNGPGENDFTPWHAWYLQPGGTYYPKPLVLLTDRYTLSAAERAVMMLKTLPQLVHLGDTTNGSISTMIGRELANGWYYSLPIQDVLFADGNSYEGKGLAPDILVRNTLPEIRVGIDQVLETAIRELSR